MQKTRAFLYAVGAGFLGGALSGFTLILTRVAGLAGGIVIILLAILLPGMAGLLLGRKVDQIDNEKDAITRSMKDAEFYLGEVAQAAVTGDEWEVGLQEEHIPTCWEVMDCSARECQVFSKRKIRCWFIAGTYCGGEVQGTFAQKITDCAACEVYQLAIDNHPIGQIHESFNNLLWVVNEKARLLSSTNAELRLKYAELEQLQTETQKMAETDYLTGLHNYGHFNEFLKLEIVGAKRFGKVLSLLMLDFDNFKKINETYSYQQGDQVLQKLADFLRETVNDKGYIARYGNEEFVIVLTGIDGEGAVGFARKLEHGFKAIAGETGVAAEELKLSIGIADFPDCAGDSKSLVSAADAALFFAKNKNDDSIAYFCDLSDTELSVDDIQRLKNRLRGAGMSTLKALARAVDATDQYLDGDHQPLGKLAGGMARKLGMDDDEVELLVLAASIHDIGKIGVPAEVLTKTDKLSTAEVEMVKKHPEIGQEILREARQIQELVLAILYHHERWDGQGYPEGLEGKKIPRMARIVGIFDAYRAMRCDRPYRKALSQREAVAELRNGSGTQFDPELVEMFVEELGVNEATELRDAG